MRIGDIIAFRKDLYFEGAVQADWFYVPEKAAKVSENFVFHGKDYYGVEAKAKNKTIDTVSLVKTIAQKFVNSSNPLSLAIADYGTGKSHLAVTLGQLFSGASYMPETFKKIIENIKKIDEEAATEIKELCTDRNFVIVINGMKDFNLHYGILRATSVEDDMFRTTVKVCAGPTFYRWVFGAGGKIVIESPIETRNEYREMLQNALNQL